MNDEDEKKQPYRRLATDALIFRFRDGLDDPELRKVRRLISLKALKLMKRSRDPEGLSLIEDILYAWYRPKVREYRFKASDKIKARSRAYARMKKYLEKDAAK